jgi:hypothetical protein
MSRTYTKSDLERIVMAQLENLNAMHDLLSILKHQNELLHRVNEMLRDEISETKERQRGYPVRRRGA